MSALTDDLTERFALALSDLVAASKFAAPADGKAIAAFSKFDQDKYRRRLKGELDRSRELLDTYYKRR